MITKKRTPSDRTSGRGQNSAADATSFSYNFPAIRGVQAKREYFISMCPLRLITRLFPFIGAELPPELRAQRVLNKNRIPEMAKYVLDNRDDYVFSALTVSIDGEVSFEPLSDGPEDGRLGMLRVPMDARFLINDGQHRRAAIEMALAENPAIGDETIAIVFFLDLGLERCQQMFADLNRHAIRPSKSIGVLYDHRDDHAKLARLVVLKSDFFKDVVEMEKSSLSLRSRKLFTLSAVYHATEALMTGLETDDLVADAAIAQEFLEEVAAQFQDWQLVRAREKSAGEVRREYIHSHGIVLQALGRVGNALLRKSRKNGWKTKLKKLATINWRRSNAAMWEGRALIGGSVSKAGHNVTLTTNAIKKHLKIALTPEEQRVEDAFKHGHGK